MNARTLVGAVFAPHHAEDTEFGDGRLASEQYHNLVVFRGCELMRGDNVGRDAHEWVTREFKSDRKTINPSVPPIRSSAARSGCGIMPMTLRASLTIPAMSRIEPLGLSRYRRTTRFSASSRSKVASSAT